MQSIKIQSKILLGFPITLLILNILDIISTHIGLTYYGLIETNPMYGTIVILVKIILSLFLILSFYKIKGMIIIPLIAFTTTLNIFIFSAVVNNISLIIGRM